MHCIINNQLQWQLKSNFNEFSLLLELNFTHYFSKQHSSTTNCFYVQFSHGFFFCSLTCFLSYGIIQSVRSYVLQSRFIFFWCNSLNDFRLTPIINLEFNSLHSLQFTILCQLQKVFDSQLN